MRLTVYKVACLIIPKIIISSIKNIVIYHSLSFFVELHCVYASDSLFFLSPYLLPFEAISKNGCLSASSAFILLLGERHNSFNSKSMKFLLSDTISNIYSKFFRLYPSNIFNSSKSKGTLLLYSFNSSELNHPNTSKIL